MAVDRELPGWGLWGRWVLASAAGFGFGEFLGMSLAWATVGVVSTGSDVTPTFFSMAYLETMGEPGDAGRALRYSAIYAPGGEFILLTVEIVVGGLMQWLVLRRHLGWARWWALPVPLSTPDENCSFVAGEKVTPDGGDEPLGRLLLLMFLIS